MGRWTDADTSAYSGDSSSKVAKAEHDARDHATEEGVFERGNKEKNGERFSKDNDAGHAATGFWNSIFGKKD